MHSMTLTSALASVALLLAAPAAAQSSSGCGKQPTLKNGVNTINGREYILKIPDGYNNNNPHSLVFGFHWRGGNMRDVSGGTGIEPWYGLETRAQGSAIFVSPNGRNAGWANPGGEDVRFVDSIIEAVEKDLCVDGGRRFATGFSFGGGMSYALACSRATKFKAVSVLAGGLISGCDGGRDSIAYLGIHGTNDGVLGINGGINLLNRFVQNNGCQAAEVKRPNTNSRGSARTDFTGCSKPVSFIAFDGGHDGAPLGVGNPLAPDATWKFFTAAAGGAASPARPPAVEAPETPAETPAAETPAPETPAPQNPAPETPAEEDEEEDVPCDGAEVPEEEDEEEDVPCDGSETVDDGEAEEEEEVPCEDTEVVEEDPEEEDVPCDGAEVPEEEEEEEDVPCDDAEVPEEEEEEEQEGEAPC